MARATLIAYMLNKCTILRISFSEIDSLCICLRVYGQSHILYPFLNILFTSTRVVGWYSQSIMVVVHLNYIQIGRKT